MTEQVNNFSELSGQTYRGCSQTEAVLFANIDYLISLFIPFSDVAFLELADRQSSSPSTWSRATWGWLIKIRCRTNAVLIQVSKFRSFSPPQVHQQGYGRPSGSFQSAAFQRILSPTGRWGDHQEGAWSAESRHIRLHLKLLQRTYFVLD